MVKPAFRRKSIGTKVSEEEYARLEALAGGRAMSEWVREVLLRELDGGRVPQDFSVWFGEKHGRKCTPSSSNNRQFQPEGGPRFGAFPNRGSFSA